MSLAGNVVGGGKDLIDDLAGGTRHLLGQKSSKAKDSN
jgi:hypothetical protein